jgi:uncharacterized membrane protein YciS (DUF1049 family)
VAYAGAAVLHALWDSMSSIASSLALLFTGNALQELSNGFLLASTADAVESLSTVLYIVGLVIAAVIGILTMWLVLRHYRRKERLRDEQNAPLSPSDLAT